MRVDGNIFWRRIHRMGRHPWLFGACLFLGSFAICAIVAWARWPHPLAHDEFSYLLQGDTFHEGRLTNPSHPQWRHFETFHVLQQPTYQSKYPVGQGLALALGTAIGRHPLVGVWLSSALASVAVYYMLRAWLPASWAVFGSLTASMRIVFGTVAKITPGYWSQSYWGGSVAAFGGALFLGGFRRWTRRRRVLDAAICAAGIAILANTRPFEGLVLVCSTLVAMPLCYGKSSFGSGREFLLKFAMPAAVILAPVGWGMTVYNRAVTGDYFTMPYFVYERTYNPTPQFMVQQRAPTDIQWGNEVMRRFYLDEEPVSSRDSIPTRMMRRLAPISEFYFGYALTLLLIPLPWLWQLPWLRMALVICSCVFAAGLLAHAFFPHYVAPITGLLFLLVIGGLRYCCVVLRHNRHGRDGVRNIFALAVIIVSISPVISYYFKRASKGHWSDVRAKIDSDLSRSGIAHLILVNYGKGHRGSTEWVYNRADIDRSPVIWARDLGPEQNRKLFDYFPRRRRWLLLADENPPALVPLKPTDAAAR